MRVVMFEELGISCSYTLEASFSGLNGYHFNTDDLKNMGRDFVLSLNDFSAYLDIETATLTAPNSSGNAAESFPVDDSDLKIDPSSSPTPGADDPPTTPLNDHLQQEMNYWRRHDGDDNIDLGEESAGSDSDPSGDNLTEAELKKRLARQVAKKKKGGKVSTRLSHLSKSKPKAPAMPPRRPDGKRPSGGNRRSFTDAESRQLRSRTPRGSQSGEGMWGGSMAPANRAQSANSSRLVSHRKSFQPAHAPMFKTDSNNKIGEGSDQLNINMNANAKSSNNNNNNGNSSNNSEKKKTTGGGGAPGILAIKRVGA